MKNERRWASYLSAQLLQLLPRTKWKGRLTICLCLIYIKNSYKRLKDSMVYKNVSTLWSQQGVCDTNLQLQPNFHNVTIETNCSFVSDLILKDTSAKCNNLLSTLVMWEDPKQKIPERSPQWHDRHWAFQIPERYNWQLINFLNILFCNYFIGNKG